MLKAVAYTLNELDSIYNIISSIEYNLDNNNIYPNFSVIQTHYCNQLIMRWSWIWSLDNIYNLWADINQNLSAYGHILPKIKFSEVIWASEEKQLAQRCLLAYKAMCQSRSYFWTIIG